MKTVLIDPQGEYQTLVKSPDVLRASRIVKGEDVIEILLTGKIITWNNPSGLRQPRFYKHNTNNEALEYSDDLRNWNKSSRNFKDFKRELSSCEWLVVE